MNKYYTVNAKQMKRLANQANRSRFQGCNGGDSLRFSRTDGRRMIHFYWPELDDIPQTIVIHDRGYRMRHYELSKTA